MASIYSVTDRNGKVVYCLNFIDVHGKRVRQRLGPHRKLAEERLNEVRVELQRGRMGRQIQELTIDEAIKRFLEESKAGRSHGTYLKQEFAFRIFRRFLKKKFPKVLILSAITPRMISDFKVARLNSATSPYTVKSDLGYISHLFNWCVRMDYSDGFNPVRRVDPPKLYQKAPRVFSLDELKAIFSAAGDRRDFYEFLYRSGFRLNDVCHIQIKDFDLKNNLICYHNRKGCRDEWTEINKHLLPTIERRMRNRRPEDFLFPFEQSTRGVKHNFLRLEFKRLIARLGLPDATLHDFKSSFVTHLLDAGVHPRIAQQLAHHEKLETTLGYARKPSHDQMKGAINQLPV